MSPELLLERFGYLAIFIGSFLEGEAILVAAGFFALRGYLDIFWVGTIGFLGAYVGHLFWFWLGRRYGLSLLDRFPRMKKHLGKSIRLFERYGATAIIITQWLYGLRITCAVIIGMSRIGIIKFLIYQAISCLIWAVAITAAGYYFGYAIESLLGRAEHIEKWGLGAIVLIAVAFFIYHQWKERRANAT
ncbi:MAG TPA: DedA family protein [Thermoanaerobaculia bacterium]|jgi:membrane protein DedA with SNARE-associated domain